MSVTVRLGLSDWSLLISQSVSSPQSQVLFSNFTFHLLETSLYCCFVCFCYFYFTFFAPLISFPPSCCFIPSAFMSFPSLLPSLLPSLTSFFSIACSRCLYRRQSNKQAFQITTIQTLPGFYLPSYGSRLKLKF